MKSDYTASLSARAFKQVVSAVTRFPPISALAGAEVIQFQVKKGRATAFTTGMVSSYAKSKAEGSLRASNVDRRVLESFASACPEGAVVRLGLRGPELLLKCKNIELTGIAAEGKDIVMPLHKETPRITLSKRDAMRVSYLAAVALDDRSRSDLACVMLAKDGNAYACNQKTIAAMKLSKVATDTAVPLPLAKIVVADDELLLTKKETVLHSKGAIYAMPSATDAQTKFPLAAVQEFGAMKHRKKLVGCTGEIFVKAIADCAVCLGQLARTAVIARFTVKGDRLLMQAANGGARFKTSIPILEGADGETFYIAVESLTSVVPFMGEQVRVTRGGSGDTFVSVGGGWALFPLWEKKAKKDKKAAQK